MIYTRLGGLIVLAMGVLAFVIAQGQAWMINRDWFTYWGGGRGILDGLNLYDSRVWHDITFRYGSTWFPNPVFIYTPATAIFFAPLSALSIQAASVIWLWLTEIFIAAVVIMIARDLKWTRSSRYAPFWGLGIVLFMPVMLTLLMGQVSALVLVVVAAAAVLFDRGKWLAGGLLLGLTVVKPQPVLFLIPLIGLWLILNRRWQGLAGLALSFGASGVASLLLFPNFISDWQTAATTKVGGVAGRMPTIWGLTADLFAESPFGFWIAALGAILILLAGLFVVARWKEMDALTCTSVALIASLLITPYLWSYDQILLLIPFIVALIRLDQRGYSFWLIALFPLIVDLAALVLFAIAAIRLQETTTFLLPVIIGILLYFALKWSPRTVLIHS